MASAARGPLIWSECQNRGSFELKDGYAGRLRRGLRMDEDERL
jgi:hypothetical protein